MNLDRRMMIMKDGKYGMEGDDCQYAKQTIYSKKFKDRLKLVLASKTYMNDLIIRN